ncbi:MAG: hypothetical protein RL481_1723 [Pseudomonadota bacterium]|jgi:hypothetical protein
MFIIILAWSLTAMCSAYAVVAGGPTGRIGAALNVGAMMATLAAQNHASWSQTHVPVMMIDLAMMAALYALALKSKVYWPIWAAGFHLITVSGHAATLIVPDIRSSLYYLFNGMWAIFVQLAMVWGITLDRAYLPKQT